MANWDEIGQHLQDNSPSNAYLLLSDGFYKVGIADNIQARIGTLQIGNPHEISLVTSFSAPRKTVEKFEEELHGWLSIRGLHVRGEWFYLTTVLSEVLSFYAKGEVPALTLGNSVVNYVDPKLPPDMPPEVAARWVVYQVSHDN